MSVNYVNWNPIVSSLLSTLVGGGISLYATLYAHKLERKRAKEEQEELIKSFLHSLLDQTECLWSRYNKVIGQYLDVWDPKIIPINDIWEVSDGYFIILEQNAHLIGHIRNFELRKKIVVTHIEAKGFLDSFKTHNQIVKSKNIDKLKDYGPIIKDEHENFKKNMTELQTMLKQELKIKEDI